MRKRRRIVAAFFVIAALGAAICNAQAKSSIPRDEETEAETEDGNDEGETAEASGGGAGGGGSQTPVEDHLLRELLHQQARFLLFSTTDLWRQGGFVHGGLLFAPSGLDREGPVVKLIAGGGLYRYISGALNGTDVLGRMTTASILPGYRFRRDRLTATVFLGADIQQHRLLPDDSSASLRGSYVGVRTGIELWYQPTDWGMISADASASTIGGSYDARLAAGIRAFDLFYFGPEVKGFRAGGNYRQLRAGLHLTGLRLGDYEWTAGFGWATDSDEHNGAYGMLSFGIRR